MPSSVTLQRVSDVAADQWGLITRRQISDAGIPPTTLDRLTAPGSALQRVASGVYHLAGAPIPDHVDLRAAWLQLAPQTLVWERTPGQGVVSHRSAAAVYGIGHLPADNHEFTLPTRRQTRRPDVKIHIRPLTPLEWISLNALPVTRPSRIASDLLREHEDPEAVAQIVVDARRKVFDYPGTFAAALASHAGRFGFRRGDGLALLAWLLSLADAPEADRWLDEAHAAAWTSTSTDRQPATLPKRTCPRAVTAEISDWFTFEIGTAQPPATTTKL